MLVWKFDGEKKYARHQALSNFKLLSIKLLSFSIYLSLSLSITRQHCTLVEARERGSPINGENIAALDGDFLLVSEVLAPLRGSVVLPASPNRRRPVPSWRDGRQLGTQHFSLQR